MTLDSALFLVYSLFVVWVLFLGGAEWLEGCMPSFRRELFSRLLVPATEAPVIRLYVAIGWLLFVALGFI